MFQRSLNRLHVVLNHTKMNCASMCLDSHNDTIFQTVNKLAMVILNRPKALNSLNYSMMRKIYPQMKTWETDPEVGVVLMKGAGEKAFCAGGDILALTQQEDGKFFFLEEYKLDYKIGTYKKPFIAVIDGITMGGGVGLSVHGMFRVATERTVFAMPETGIGLIPDVGGGYVLPRLQGKLGIFLGLTGHRLKGRDVQMSGIASHYIDSNKISEMEESLVSLDKPSAENVGQLLDSFHKESTAEPKEFVLKSKMADINRLFSGSTVEEIFKALEQDDSEWALKQLKIMQKMSPTSMKLSLRHIREGGKRSLKECFEVENRLCQRCLEDKDFYEGVRAAIVDKDQNPQWVPDALGDVTDARVDYYFSRLPEDRELVLE